MADDQPDKREVPLILEAPRDFATWANSLNQSAPQGPEGGHKRLYGPHRMLSPGSQKPARAQLRCSRSKEKGDQESIYQVNQGQGKKEPVNAQVRLVLADHPKREGQMESPSQPDHQEDTPERTESITTR